MPMMSDGVNPPALTRWESWLQASAKRVGVKVTTDTGEGVLKDLKSSKGLRWFEGLPHEEVGEEGGEAILEAGTGIVDTFGT